MVIPQEHLKEVCKIGQGDKCCRYVYADGDGIQCAKLDDAFRTMIDTKVALGLFVAIGDNCGGY
jgi:hypothetical protein